MIIFSARNAGSKPSPPTEENGIRRNPLCRDSFVQHLISGNTSFFTTITGSPENGSLRVLPVSIFPQQFFSFPQYDIVSVQQEFFSDFLPVMRTAARIIK